MPITTILTSALLHKSRIVIPIMELTAKKVTSLYDRMDSAYDAESIYQVSRSLDHIPVIDKNPRRGSVIPMTPAEEMRYHERTIAEHTNGRLKEEFGGSKVKVRGHIKVKLHLMFGIIALFAGQLLRLA